MLLRRQLRLAGATAAVSFSRHRRYCFDAPAARGFIASRRHIWLVCFVGLVCLVGLVYLIGLVYLLVCLLVGLLVWLVWCLGSVGLVCLKRSGLEVGLSGCSGLSIAVSVGLLVWVTIVVTHGDLATDSSIKIFAGCWFGSRS